MNALNDRKLILHIGAHKTGTTAIQEFLGRRQSDLNLIGWAFCAQPNLPANWGHIIEVRPVLGGANYRLKPKAFGNLLARVDSGKRHLVISAEDFFFLESPDIETFATAMLGRFTEISVVSYLRRQDLMTLSHWAQGAQTVQSALIFGSMDYPLPKLNPFMQVYLDYAARLEKWQAALPQARMVVRVYDRDLLPNRDVVQDFLTATGLEISQDGPATDINVAFGATTVRFVYMLRAAGIEQRQILRILNRRLLEITGDKLLPSRTEAEQFVAQFGASNARLAAMTGQPQVFSSDFSHYPEIAVVSPLDAAYVQRNLLTLLADALSHVGPGA